MNELLARLAAPFDPDQIEWRIGATKGESGLALAYIDARTVQDRLDEVCGIDWASEHIVAGGSSKVTCRIGIKIGNDWVWRSNGAGDTDVEGDKGSYSDSFKRAATMWRIGRYLYDIKSPWVAIEKRGNSSFIKDSEYGKLRAALTGKPAPVQREPERAAVTQPPTEAFLDFKAMLDNISELKQLEMWGADIARAFASGSITGTERLLLVDLYKKHKQSLTVSA